MVFGLAWTDGLPSATDSWFIPRKRTWTRCLTSIRRKCSSGYPIVLTGQRRTQTKIRDCFYWFLIDSASVNRRIPKAVHGVMRSVIEEPSFHTLVMTWNYLASPVTIFAYHFSTGCGKHFSLWYLSPLILSRPPPSEKTSGVKSLGPSAAVISAQFWSFETFGTSLWHITNHGSRA